MPGPAESHITRQGVRNLNLVGPRPRRAPPGGVEIWHQCTADARTSVDPETGAAVLRCGTCGRILGTP